MRPKAGGQEQEARSDRPGARGQERQARSDRPGAKGQEREARNRRPGAGGQEQKARSRRPGAGNLDQEDRVQPGAKRHHMVSGTLAPLYTVFGLKLGCSGAAAPIGDEVL